MHMIYVSFKVTTWTSPSRPVVSSVWAPTCFRPVTCGPPRPPGMRPSWPRWRGETLGEWLVNGGWMVGEWLVNGGWMMGEWWVNDGWMVGEWWVNGGWFVFLGLGNFKQENLNKSERWPNVWLGKACWMICGKGENSWVFSCIPHTYRYWIFMIFHAHPLMATRSRIPMYPPWRSLRMALHRFCPRTSVRSGKTEGRTWFWG